MALAASRGISRLQQDKELGRAPTEWGVLIACETPMTIEKLGERSRTRQIKPALG